MQPANFTWTVRNALGQRFRYAARQRVLPLITGGGLAAPKSLALDASGKLYVANDSDGQTSSSMSIFDTLHGNAASAPITGAGTAPTGLAIDANGKLYVANFRLNNVSVFDTLHGNAALAPITGGGLSHTMGMAIR